MTATACLTAFACLATFAVAAEPVPTYTEKYRPRFHFTAAKDWLNDPNGLVYYEGEYHLFFQRTPNDLAGREHRKDWGHAVSTDLFHWTQLPDAIVTDDAGSIWSGSAVVDWTNSTGFGRDGKPPLVAIYTTAKTPFSQSLAYSNDKGRTWTKFAGNPVLPNVNGTNRDPKVIWHEPTKKWVMALYLDRRHQFALFTSPDLKQWTHLQDVTLDGDDECPDFFPLNLDGDPEKPKWVFIAANNRYVVGSFDGKTFTRETDVLPSEFGPNFYAAQTFSDTPDGRRIQIGWMRRDGLYPGMPFNQQMSLPCELTLKSTPRGPRLFRYPVREVENLADGKQHHSMIERSLGKDNLLRGIACELLDVDVRLVMGSAKSVTLNVRGQPITLHAEGKAVALTGWTRRVSLPVEKDEIRLRVLVDRTSIEIFVQDGLVALSGCFLFPDENKTISLTADGGEATVFSLIARPLPSTWPVAAK